MTQNIQHLEIGKERALVILSEILSSKNLRVSKPITSQQDLPTFAIMGWYGIMRPLEKFPEFNHYFLKENKNEAIPDDLEVTGEVTIKGHRANLHEALGFINHLFNICGGSSVHYMSQIIVQPKDLELEKMLLQKSKGAEIL